MNFRKLLTEDRAVSPVIGVILMVAITVILAAVIGTFVLGLGDQVSESAPQAQFTFDFNDKSGATNDLLNITHDGGDAIDAGTLKISSSGADIQVDKGDGSYSGTGTSVELTDDQWVSGDSISAGTTIFVQSSGDLSGDTVRIVWTSPNSDKTATIGQFEA